MDRKKILDQYIKTFSENLDFPQEDLSLYNMVEDKNQPLKLALQSRGLSEEALAKKVLDNTGIPIPGKGAKASKWEDFLNRIVQEQYPEFDPKANVLDFTGDMSRAHGFYDPKDGLIGINKNVITPENPFKPVATALHEAGHKYDDKVLNYSMPETLLQGDNSGIQLNKNQLYDEVVNSRSTGLPDPSPMKMNEIASKGHHARIPNLRDGDSFGVGALKSYLKKGAFRAIPFIGPALAVNAAVSSKDVNAAVPILGEAEPLGPEKGSIDYMIENPDPKMTPEQRRKALDRLLKQEK